MGTETMNEPFNLSVIYKGEEQEFKARFERWGPAFRFAVLIGENTVTFEPDEEGGYRALTGPEQTASTAKINVHLLQAIAEKLTKLGN